MLLVLRLTSTSVPPITRLVIPVAAAAWNARRRIKTEEKAKVVTVVWGMYLKAALNI